MQSQLIEGILKIYPNFPPDELKKGLVFFKIKTYKAKQIALDFGSVSDELFFPEQSLTLCFYIDKEGVEQTLWIKPEKSFLTEFKSFVYPQASQFSLQFYEDTTVHCISRKDLLELYQTSNAWAQFGVFLTEALHVTLIDVFVNLLANDATRNYQYIEYMFPRFLQVAPLKDIASMLQISQVSLSRIRAGKQTKN